MSLDTRARRAADGVRASTTGMTVTDAEGLRRDLRARRWATSVGIAAATAAVVAGGMLVRPDLSGIAEPARPDSATFGELLGVTASVPDGWTGRLNSEGFAVVTLDAEPGVWVFLGHPTGVLDETIEDWLPMPEDYADWLRSHPSAEVLADRQVLVDGRAVDQITYRMTEGTTGAVAAWFGPWSGTGQPDNGPEPDWWLWALDDGDAVMTETVLDVDGRTVIVQGRIHDEELLSDEIRGTAYEQALADGMAAMLESIDVP